MKENDYKITMGKKVRQLRKSLNLTQDAFSECIDLESNNLSKIETGKSFPSMQTLKNIMSAFHTDANYFFETNYFNNPETVAELIKKYIEELPFNKKVLALKIIMLINENDKNG